MGKSFVEIGDDFLRIECLPRSQKIQNEFFDDVLKKKVISEDMALKYKDPEKTKMHVRNKLRELNYTVLHGELDHWDVQLGRGPMFRQVDSKLFILSFKGKKAHLPTKILGWITALVGIGAFILTLNTSDEGYITLGIISLIALIWLGSWIGRSPRIWIKGTGAAHRIKGQDIFSDQLFEFGGDCGFEGMSKMKLFRDDFDKIMKDVVQFLGESKNSD